jgi:cell division protein FtsB
MTQDYRKKLALNKLYIKHHTWHKSKKWQDGFMIGFNSAWETASAYEQADVAAMSQEYARLLEENEILKRKIGNLNGGGG